jgi:2-desacetyl-2-hydroxyethyl bacteriochlorophyllide A dehydrogenase
MEGMLSLYFYEPGRVEVRPEPLPLPGPGQVLVRTLLSAISPGTEMLVYRGQFPGGTAVDPNISALAGAFSYPLRYGYSCVGQVEMLGDGVASAWDGRRVFAFQPHASHFLAAPDELLPLPDGIDPQQAVFLPNMETAVNFVMDGAPLIGEQAAVFGQGIVGLLTTALLSRFPLAALVALDPFELRRQAALELGASASLDPFSPTLDNDLARLIPGGADLVYELSGAPAALDRAIRTARFSGRVVVGSWYGQKTAPLDLGGHFHRSRIRLVSSQVSSLAPELSGRWDKARRFELAWKMLAHVGPSRWITQRFPIQQAAQAYQLIDRSPGETIQVVLTYD